MSGPYDNLARRVSVQQAVACDLDLAARLIHSAACPTMLDSRWRSVFGEALGDLDAALARGQSDEEELRLLGALVQLQLEKRERDRAEAPLGDGA